MPRLQECPCDSGEWPEAMHDARGIFLCYCCGKCRAKAMAKYRPDVLTDSNYWADEEIEGDS